jgi:hypothetical protein
MGTEQNNKRWAETDTFNAPILVYLRFPPNTHFSRGKLSLLLKCNLELIYMTAGQRQAQNEYFVGLTRSW